MELTYELLECITRAQANDEEAFAQLYKKTHLMVYNIACAEMHDTEEAKDIVSEVYIRVFRHLSSLRDPHSFIRWLTIITHHVCADHINNKSFTAELPESFSDGGNEKFINEIEEWHAHEALQATFEKLLHLLPEAQQRAVQYVYFNQLSLGQAAALEGCSINTIKSRLYYARNTLRRAIEEEEQRTGDKLYLAPVSIGLAALLALPQIPLSLSPEESARIFATILSAISISQSAQTHGATFFAVDDICEEDNPVGQKGLGVLKRRYFMKFTPMTAITAAFVLVLAAICCLAVGYAINRSDLPATVSNGSLAEPAEENVSTIAPEQQSRVSVRSDNGHTEYRYETSENGIVLTSVMTDLTTLTIPAEINGLPVVELADDVFASSLWIETLHLPASLQTVSGLALSVLDGLASITVDENSAALTAVNGVLYSADLSTLIAYPNDKPGSGFTIPGDVRVVGDYAMCSRHLLNIAVAVRGIEIFGDYALAGCENLTAFTLPATTHTLGENALACPSVTEFKVYAGGDSF
ncbi:MAG: sigma-70 family RNA polymerase sigma factor, partial [Clostridia bacterium]|nr:sigma-70 family RNA polymerase sigma factor [Clostridia bacterium]